MIGDYAQFDFGNSFYRDVPVAQLIAEKLPVSISLGLWTTLITYLISIPLGIAKAREVVVVLIFGHPARLLLAMLFRVFICCFAHYPFCGGVILTGSPYGV